jgi:hypothetical protein
MMIRLLGREMSETSRLESGIKPFRWITSSPTSCMRRALIGVARWRGFGPPRFAQRQTLMTRPADGSARLWTWSSKEPFVGSGRRELLDRDPGRQVAAATAVPAEYEQHVSVRVSTMRDINRQHVRNRMHI